ncbi:hypothetical protein J7355_16630 [Endozoicomonas sp. G2_2]|uniref:hypothetical protein n=1 Tax=Endozoicomonas sp. G2_2 TaxID=2821092 RepID=UPI001AD9C0C4|nr:hypothetical protein [Endozoicomonas sp. G2_2]MBO9471718.1 hypothetical protein [Endozoicomonas sp. G2_2]
MTRYQQLDFYQRSLNILLTVFSVGLLSCVGRGGIAFYKGETGMIWLCLGGTLACAVILACVCIMLIRNARAVREVERS